MPYYILLIIFFLIALIYASVGFGGGSSYLALMAVAGLSYLVIKPAALLCNIIVVTGGTYIFYREGYLDLKKSLPFVLASVPMAFIGGYYKLQENTFFVILGSALVVAAFFLWYKPSQPATIRSSNTFVNLSLGACIGLLSGLVSIGGGIFLAPILHLMNWDNAKRISALASFFILVNSISGLLGQLAQQVEIDFEFMGPLMMAVLIGGQIGSHIGARRLNPVLIKRITAVLILIAGVNILKDHLF